VLHAKVAIADTGENPARWRGHLANLLPAPSKIAKFEHRSALPWREICAFMALLAQRFAVLTAARTGDVAGARWSEIDMTEAV
jgi:integrase